MLLLSESLVAELPRRPLPANTIASDTSEQVNSHILKLWFNSEVKCKTKVTQLLEVGNMVLILLFDYSIAQERSKECKQRHPLDCKSKKKNNGGKQQKIISFDIEREGAKKMQG